MGKRIITVALFGFFCASSVLANTQSTMRKTTERIVSKYKGVFTSPPKDVPTNKVPDGPLLGNGDVGVVISGDPELQRFWVSKNDFWLAREGNHRAGGPKLFGGIDIRILALRGAKYHVEQRLYDPEVVSTFKTKKSTVTMRSWLSDSEDLIFIELSVTGKAVSVEADLWAKSGFGTTTKQSDEEMHFVTRKFNSPDLKYPTEAAMALRTIGADPKGHLIIENSGKFVFEGAMSNRFGLKPGDKVILAAAISTNFDSETYEQDVRSRVMKLTKNKIQKLKKGHNKWWRDFWAKSFVEIGDPLIEKIYYGSLYLLASCSRNKEFPPSLIGNWVTTDNAAWHGDYHTNYNHEAPWWGVYSSNHVDLAEPYDAPIIDFIDRAKYYAKTELNCRGVYLPVGIGPKGLETTLNPPHGYPPSDGVDKGYFLGQKSNSAYTTVNMIKRFYHTYDMEYLKNTVYPYLMEVLNFWEDYLKFENGRYVIYNDHIFEGEGTDMNNLLSLGLMRLIFRAAIDMSIELGVDAERREKWQHVLDHISDFALFERNGKKVFRFAEKGVQWRDGEGDGMVAVQHIWPMGAIGYHSGPKMLKIARDHISALNRWDDFNGFCTFYTAAARVGYDPKIILSKLREQCITRSLPNLHIFHGGGGIEELSGAVSSINEMLLQSYSKIIRLFPTWPEDMPARFANLRAVGAFLVSSAYNRRQVQYVLIYSEKGRDCVLQNPWPGKKISIYRNSSKAQTLSGDTVTLKTTAGQQITLAPEGVSFNDVQKRIKAMETLMTQLPK
ncbi:MAG: glycosyl hydrolase family 95 catalytic domain-containing protein [Planctomycetota bacterium]|jgi:hypothetical protein